MQFKLLNDDVKPISYLFYASLLFIILCILVFANTFFALVKVDGDSMYPTLNDGDVLFINRLDKAERGDVVVIDHPTSGMVIKRVIAVGGDEVRCEGGVVYVKYKGNEVFTRLDEEYVYSYTPYFEETKVSEGSIFVMGDNRVISKDSKYYGELDYDLIKGVVREKTINRKNVVTALFGWTFDLQGLIYGDV